MKNTKQETPTLAELSAQLQQAQQEAATYRQQRDYITSQHQDLDAKCSIEIRRLNAVIEDLKGKLAGSPKQETGGAFGGAKK